MHMSYLHDMCDVKETPKQVRTRAQFESNPRPAFPLLPFHLTTVLNRLTANTDVYATSVVNVNPMKAAW